MNESALVLADFMPDDIPNIQSIDDQYIDFEKLFKQTKKNADPVTYHLRVQQPREFLYQIKRTVKMIKAAGGLVKNGRGEYLIIHRLGKWDLPKGKVDEGESMKKAAVREVEEECGVKIDYLGPKIMTTYHTYLWKGSIAIKKTNWYEMGVNGVPKLRPQREEDITEAVWMNKNKLQEVRQNTYPLINDLLQTIG